MESLTPPSRVDRRVEITVYGVAAGADEHSVFESQRGVACSKAKHPENIEIFNNETIAGVDHRIGDVMKEMLANIRNMLLVQASRTADRLRLRDPFFVRDNRLRACVVDAWWWHMLCDRP